MGRPATGQMPQQNIRIDSADWRDLHAVAGRRRLELIREFIRWYLRRPGARLPERPSREEIDALLARDQ